MALKYKRILLKLSGEALMGKSNDGYEPLDISIIAQYAKDVKEIIAAGAEVAIVIGGGNIYRGMLQQIAVRIGELESSMENITLERDELKAKLAELNQQLSS